MSGSVLGLYGLGCHFLFLLAVLASFYFWNWLPLICFGVLLIIVEVAMLKWVPLKAMTESQVKSNRRFLYIFAIVFVLLVVLAGVAYPQ